MDDPTKDTIPRSAVEYCLRKETVNTNPDAYEAHEKFIAYMDDPDISQFGHWMHSNGFNCALTTVKCDLDKIPSAQPEPCKDVQHILDYLDEVLHPLVSPEHWNVYSELHDMIAELPSAQPERKKGRWNCSDDMYESAVCSVCGWDTTEPWNHIRHWFNYCPKCGAKMEEGGE